MTLTLLAANGSDLHRSSFIDHRSAFYLMPFPDHIARVLDAYGVPADTKAALYDLYVSMGDEVLEVFSDVAERVSSASLLTPDDTLAIREKVVARYLARSHPKWAAGLPTPSFWHPRELEGRASGLAVPLADSVVARAFEVARAVVGEAQPLPNGISMLGRNAHFGGRQETISFDVVAAEASDAIAIAKAAGQQHTLPGSVGETSGTFDGAQRVALLWEVQPNVYKPAGDRNRDIAKIYRRHRNWHVVTLALAIAWLREQRCAIFILRGEALAPTHEVNREKPVSETIVAHHNRTVAQVAQAFGATLAETADDDGFTLLDSAVMNHALRQHVLRNGPGDLIWKLAS